MNEEVPAVVEKEKEVRPAKITDSKLKRVSISTNQILLNDNFELKKEMAELIPILSTKYRIFLITQVSADKAADHI